jgi:hypothetical protein
MRFRLAANLSERGGEKQASAQTMATWYPMTKRVLLFQQSLTSSCDHENPQKRPANSHSGQNDSLDSRYL